VIKPGLRRESLQNGNIRGWPPYRYVDYSNVVPKFKSRGADWWKDAQEEDDRKRAEAMRLEAEYLEQQARDRDRVAKAADDRRRGIIAL
jgi:hypothetical protein